MLLMRFGESSFDHELWIGNKSLFHDPRIVNVEFISAGPFEWIFADAKGFEIRAKKHLNPNGGWTSIDLSSLGINGDCSIGFRNSSPGTKFIKQGDVNS